MREITIKMTVTGEEDLVVMTVPGNEVQFEQLVVALKEVAETVACNHQEWSALAERLGIVGQSGAKVQDAVSSAMETIGPMIERNRIAVEQMLYVRMLLSKSRRARYELPADEADAGGTPEQERKRSQDASQEGLAKHFGIKPKGPMQ